MKKIVLMAVLVFGYSIPAWADTSLGQQTCGRQQCVTNTGLSIWATFRMKSALGCQPNTGDGCPMVTPGEWYVLHVNVRFGPGIPAGHARVRAKAGSIPTIGNDLEFVDVEILPDSCPIHTGGNPYVPNK